MITFVPCTDFDEIARCLDDKRLSAQRYESWLILRWLRDPVKNPKPVKAGYCTMWKGYEDALVRYVNAMLREWGKRGKNNVSLKPNMPGLEEAAGQPDMPPWFCHCETLHSYHRHALVSKNPEHYNQFGWAEDGSAYNGSYMWPVQEDDTDEWILRWPQKFKLPSIPILQSTPANCFPTTPDKSLEERKTKAAAARAKKKSAVVSPNTPKRKRANLPQNASPDQKNKATDTPKSKKRSAVVSPDVAQSKKRQGTSRGTLVLACCFHKSWRQHESCSC